MDRWDIPTLSGHRCNKALKALNILGQHAPPRVVAAVIRCMFNGWLTARRFQRKGCCILGCTEAADSIEHYAVCPEFHRLCFKHLGIGRSSCAHALEDFLCISTCSTILPAGLLAEDDDSFKSAVCLRALSLYALYKTLGSVRHSRVALAESHGAFAQHTQEAVRGHSGAISILRRCRAARRY